MAEKRTSNSAKICGYILTWMKLGLGAHAIYNEICGAYVCNEVSYVTVARWFRRFKGGPQLIKDASKSGQQIPTKKSKTFLHDIHWEI